MDVISSVILGGGRMVLVVGWVGFFPKIHSTNLLFPYIPFHMKNKLAMIINVFISLVRSKMKYGRTVSGILILRSHKDKMSQG